MSDSRTPTSDSRPHPSDDLQAGLCGTCSFAQTVASITGSEFILCVYSRIHPSFPKYPTLPVHRCGGFVGETQ